VTKLKAFSTFCGAAQIESSWNFCALFELLWRSLKFLATAKNCGDVAGAICATESDYAAIQFRVREKNGSLEWNRQY